MNLICFLIININQCDIYVLIGQYNAYLVRALDLRQHDTFQNPNFEKKGIKEKETTKYQKTETHFYW